MAKKIENKITALPIGALTDEQIQFAKDVADLAEKNGVDTFELIMKPKFDYSCRYSGNVTVSYSSKDGRGRPCRILTMSCDATIIHVIEENEESSN